MALSDEERVEQAIRRYTEHFNKGLPLGFTQTELKEPSNPSEWEQVINEAIEYNEPFNYCCEGVFDDDEIMEQERLRSARKARIAKAKDQPQKNNCQK